MRGRVRLGSAAIALWLVLPGVASAATFAVNSPADMPDTSLGDGLCHAANGSCTLRAAVQEANALVGADTIVVPAGTYHLSAGSLQIATSVTIMAPSGSSQTVLDADGKSGVLDIEGAGVDSISGLTLTGGAGASGVGVYIDGPEVSFTGVDVRGNAAVSQGAGIDLGGGQLSLLDSAVTGNTVTLSNSGEVQGAGITVESGNLLAVATTIAGNTAAGTPEGDGFGGGLSAGAGTSVTLRHVTLLDNAITGADGFGGNLYVDGTARIADSIIFGGQADGFESDCLDGTTPIVTGHNIFGGSDCPSPSGTVVASNPMLGALGDHGGTGETAVPLPGSPAIDAASACPDGGVDQRGATAPTGAACDIGAAELGADMRLTLTESASTVAPGDQITYVAKVSDGGLDSAPAAVLTLTPPHGAAVVLALPSAGSCSAAGVCDLGAMTPGATASVTAVVKAPSSGPLKASAAVTGGAPDPDLANNAASVTAMVPTSGVGAASPVLSDLRAVGKLEARKGGKLGGRLSEPATVRVVVTALTPGRRRHARCSGKVHHGAKCTIAHTLGTFSLKLNSGTIELKLPGVVSGHALVRGSYRLTATAVNAAGRRSKPDVTTVVVR